MLLELISSRVAWACKVPRAVVEIFILVVLLVQSGVRPISGEDDLCPSSMDKLQNLTIYQSCIS